MPLFAGKDRNSKKTGSLSAAQERLLLSLRSTASRARKKRRTMLKAFQAAGAPKPIPAPQPLQARKYVKSLLPISGSMPIKVADDARAFLKNLHGNGAKSLILAPPTNDEGKVLCAFSDKAKPPQEVGTYKYENVHKQYGIIVSLSGPEEPSATQSSIEKRSSGPEKTQGKPETTEAKTYLKIVFQRPPVPRTLRRRDSRNLADLGYRRTLALSAPAVGPTILGMNLFYGKPAPPKEEPANGGSHE